MRNPWIIFGGFFCMWVCLKMVSTPKPNGFADHYPVFKWLFHWEYTLFSDKPMLKHVFFFGKPCVCFNHARTHFMIM